MKPAFGGKDMNVWQELDYTSSLLGYPDYVYKLLYEYNLTAKEVIQILEMDDAWEEDVWNKKLDEIIDLYRVLLGEKGYLIDILFEKGHNRYEVVDILRKNSEYIISKNYDNLNEN